MAKQFPGFTQDQIDFVTAQHVFFVGTAAADGHVNISPKGMTSLKILGPNRVIWRNLTGSGNETAGHLALVNRITLMWCSFATRPLILRAYGTAATIDTAHPDWDRLNGQFPPDIGARQVYDVRVDRVQTSCGYAVPFMAYQNDRDTLVTWAGDKGEAGIRDYWRENNQTTIDGFPTGIPT